MKEIKISDTAGRVDNVRYIKGRISGLLKEVGGDAEISVNARARLIVKVGKDYYDYVKSELEDKIADVVAVRYKYDYFCKRLSSSGLSALDTEILYSAIIAADIDEDKRYVIKRIRQFDEFAIDGIYNFRLQPLKRKWGEIVGYIPSYFGKEHLKDFVGYLIGEKKGRRTRVDKGEVYDVNFNKLRRTLLTGKSDEGRIIREVILSACGDVDVMTELPKTDEKYLRDLYGNRAHFLF